MMLPMRTIPIRLPARLRHNKVDLQHLNSTFRSSGCVIDNVAQRRSRLGHSADGFIGYISHDIDGKCTPYARSTMPKLREYSLRRSTNKSSV